MMENGIERVGRMLDWENELFQRIQYALCNPQVDLPEILVDAGRFFSPGSLYETADWKGSVPEKAGSIAKTDAATDAQAERVFLGAVDSGNVRAKEKNSFLLQEKRTQTERTELRNYFTDAVETEPAPLNPPPAERILSRMYDSDREDISQIRKEPNTPVVSPGMESAPEEFGEFDGTVFRERAEELLFGDAVSSDKVFSETGSEAYSQEALETAVSFDRGNSVHETFPNDFFQRVSEAQEDFIPRIPAKESDIDLTEETWNRSERERQGQAFRAGLSESEMNQMFDYMVQMLEEAVSTEAEGFYPL